MSNSAEKSTTRTAAPKTRNATRRKTALRESRPDTDKLPPHNLVLHNDPVNDMTHVVESLVSVTPTGKHSALRIMLTAHFRGRAIVMTTHKERAELYRDRLASKKLTATVEPAG